MRQSQTVVINLVRIRPPSLTWQTHFAKVSLTDKRISLGVRIHYGMYRSSSSAVIFCLTSSISPSTSSFDRLKFSILKAYTVISAIPRSKHHLSVSKNFSNHKTWPWKEWLQCILLANRLFPSIIMYMPLYPPCLEDPAAQRTHPAIGPSTLSPFVVLSLMSRSGYENTSLLTRLAMQNRMQCIW